MFNLKCKSGKNTKAARRAAAMLMTGTMTAALTISGLNPAPVNVSAASWQENADYIFDYLTQRLKYSEAAACGIMANIRCESTFNPHAWNAGGGSYGLCQWTGGRYSRLRNWCGSNGYDYTTVDGQMAYLQYELQNNYTGVENYIRSVENTADGAYLAGQYYCYHFEAPASRGSVSVYRGNLASGVFWESYRPAEWYQKDGLWHFILRDGSYKTGWLEIEGDTFYLDDDGNRIYGWKNIEGSRYFFDDDGLMVSGWKKIDGRSYYFDEDGSLVTGVIHNNDDWYLVDKDGDLKSSPAAEEYAIAWAKETERGSRELAAAGTGQDNAAGQDHSVSQDYAAGQDHSVSLDNAAGQDNASGQDNAAGQNYTASRDISASQDEHSDRDTLGQDSGKNNFFPNTSGINAADHEENTSGNLTALAEANPAPAGQSKRSSSSFAELTKKEDTGSTDFAGKSGNQDSAAADAVPEEAEQKTATASEKMETEKEPAEESSPAELLRQSAEQGTEEEDQAQQGEDTSAEQYAAAAQAALSAAITLNKDQEEEEEAFLPSAGLAFSFYYDQPEEADRILSPFRSGDSPEEGDNDRQNVSDSVEKGFEGQPAHHEQAENDGGAEESFLIPVLVLADEEEQDKEDGSSGDEKEPASDDGQVLNEGSGDQGDPDRKTDETSGHPELSGEEKDSDEEKDAEPPAERQGTEDTAGLKKDGEKNGESTGMTDSTEESEEGSSEKDDDESSGQSDDEASEKDDDGSSDGSDQGSSDNAGKDKGDSSGFLKETEEDPGKDPEHTDSRKENKNEDKEEEKEEDKEEKDGNSEDSKESAGDDTKEDTENDSEDGSKNDTRDDTKDDTKNDTGDDTKEEAKINTEENKENSEDRENDRDSAKEEIHIRLTEKKFYDVQENELEDLADLLCERKVLHVVNGEDRDITSDTYLDVEKINKRDYGFSVIIRAEYGDSSDEEKVRIYVQEP